jgi:hypothetical protein
MFPTDMIVLKGASETGSASVGDYYCSSYQGPSLDTELGGSDDLTVEEITHSNGILRAVISRPLDTGDENDFVLDPIVPTDFCYALHPTDTTMTQMHTIYGSDTVLLSDDTSATPAFIKLGSR